MRHRRFNAAVKFEQFIRIFAKSSEPCLIGLFNGRVVYQNKAFELLSGHSAAELKRLNWKKDLTFGKIDEVQNERLRRLGREENSLLTVQRYERKDGVNLLLEGTLRKIDCYFLIIVRVLDEKDTKSKIRFLLRENVQNYLQSFEVPILVLDKKYRIYFANRAMETLNSSGGGVSLKNRYFSELLQPSSRGRMPGKMTKVAGLEYRMYTLGLSETLKPEFLCAFFPVRHEIIGNWIMVLLHPLKEILFGSAKLEAAALASYRVTDREKSVLALLLGGYLYKEIGDKLSISLPTVRTHVQSLYRKFQVASRDQLFRKLRTDDAGLNSPSSLITSFFRDLEV